MSYRVRELRVEDAEAYVALRHLALTESPLSFASSVEDDFVSSHEAVREQLRRTPESTIYGAFESELVGALGIFRNRHIKSSHKAHVWGMYVVPSHRRQGIGTELLRAVLDHTRTLQGVTWVYLSVSSAAPQAQRLYEGFGFSIWGSEPQALRHDGQSVVEHHMALVLE